MFDCGELLAWGIFEIATGAMDGVLEIEFSMFEVEALTWGTCTKCGQYADAKWYLCNFGGFWEITKNLNSISLCLIHTHEAYLKYGVDFFLVCFGKVVKIKKLD